MRSGGLDCEITFVRPGAPAREGRSRVPGADVPVAERVPCRVFAGQGTERFANDQNSASAPIVIYARREPDIDTLDAGDSAIMLETGKRYAITSVRPYSGDPRTGGGDPRRDMEILAVASGAA